MDDRERRRRQLMSLLGDVPPAAAPISAKLCCEERHEHYHLEKLMLELNGIEPVPAYFVRPLRIDQRAPAILFNHAHGGDYILGKDELINGRPHYLQAPCYAEELARMGVCSLCIDCWGFGERRGRTESEIFKDMLWHGRVMWGMMVFDSLRAVEYLVSRGDVDAQRIGTLGLSMGSTMAWWVAALDTRIKACVDICCLTDYQALIETRGLDRHGIYYYVPDLLRHFTTLQINELICPRAHLALAGNYDPLTPPAGLDRIDAGLRQAYRAANSPDAWQLARYETGHFETADMRTRVLSFLRERL